MTSFEFSGSLDSYDGEMEALSHMVYKYDSYCNTTFADSLTAFYIITNTDGDGILEVEDTTHCWSTAMFHNGDYYILARISDFDGNSTVDSMIVTVGNYFAFSGHIDLEGSYQDQGATVISISPANLTAATVADGDFTFPAVGGGYQTVSISRPGYVTFDTLMLFDRSHDVEITLSMVDFVCGDANFDALANIADAVYMINFVFKNGPAPVPLDAGDANCDGSANVADAVYLINYVFKGGPAPCRP
jgi:hypothetical protein